MTHKTNPNDPDFWPRYAIFETALKLSMTAALKYKVRELPTHAWSHEQILLVALETLREEQKHRSSAQPQAAGPSEGEKDERHDQRDGEAAAEAAPGPGVQAAPAAGSPATEDEPR